MLQTIKKLNFNFLNSINNDIKFQNLRINRYFSVNYFQLQQQQQQTSTVNNDDLDILYKRVFIEVRGHEPAVLKSYEQFVKLTAQGLDLKDNLINIYTPERFIERWSLLKAKVNKKNIFRQYEMRTYFKQFEFKHLTGSTASTLLEYIQRNLPEGVSMYVYKTKLEALPDNLTRQPNTNEN